MATWTVQITVTDLATKRCTVTGVRTDGADVRTFSVDTTIGNTPIATAKAAIIDSLWQQYQASVTKLASEATIKNWEAALATALIAKETA